MKTEQVYWSEVEGWSTAPSELQGSADLVLVFGGTEARCELHNQTMTITTFSEV